jgi:hypothetical protein
VSKERRHIHCLGIFGNCTQGVPLGFPVFGFRPEAGLGAEMGKSAGREFRAAKKRAIRLIEANI